MKNQIILLLFLTFSSEIIAQNNESLRVILSDGVAKESNILGLQYAEVTLINTLPHPILIHSPEHWRFYSTVQNEEVSFSERKMRTFDPLTLRIKPHDTIRVVLNLNFFDLYSNYAYYSGKALELPCITSLKLGVHCEYDNSIHYSEEYNIVLKPLDPIDVQAFEYIKANDSDPYKFTSIGFIADKYRGKPISDSVLIKYPGSTFAELASLSLAYSESGESKAKPALKESINQLLEKPLASKYSFVRYLAEELKKKL